MQYLIRTHTKTARILHWFNMFCITMLIMTGFYMHSPLQFDIFPSMDTARKIHFIFMYLVIYGVLVRVYYAYYKRDYQDILFSPADIKGFLPLIQYYLFMSDTPPETGKYNAGQKFIYTGWVFLILVQAWTGFILYFPTSKAVYVRQVHFMVTWVFTCTIALHVYLSIISGKEALKSIFTGSNMRRL